MKILFICTGNTCRSCMAEAIFNQMSDYDVKAISAGIAAISGTKASKNTVALIKDNFSKDLSDRNAVQLQEEMLSESDLILTMTGYIRDALVDRFPQYKNKLFTLNEYVDLKEDIIDPFGGDMEVYQKTFDILKKSIGLLLNKIKEDNGI
ncbi:low molecular weight protein arginine phosphatase [Clostridium sp. ZS2-4]|uniref:low molecular weight protein arginine phosphatase n=1 Tax=Clostridium sp. ZS2-4 TaxID=2987703 RepID=UPI00227C63CC|nr:low molecular weight protein arginine phosphatase [Clostridium sp. ZS2-4]MCY6355493.1 low molecular weight protein arginine phosphatase [Clostridium sp. ZS2-4]